MLQQQQQQQQEVAEQPKHQHYFSPQPQLQPLQQRQRYPLRRLQCLPQLHLVPHQLLLQSLSWEVVRWALQQWGQMEQLSGPMQQPQLPQRAAQRVQRPMWTPVLHSSLLGFAGQRGRGVGR